MLPPNSRLVLVSGYAPADGPGIQAFRFDMMTGTLTPLGALPGIRNPSFLALHSDGRWLYATSETSEAAERAGGGVAAAAVAHEPWAARWLNRQDTRGDHPCHLALDPTGRWLVVSNYTSGSVAVFPVGVDGSLGAMSGFVQHAGHSINPQRQEGPHAHSATFAPNSPFVIVADLGLDALVVYRFDNAAGTLTEVGRGAARPGAGPRHVAWHPTGRALYVGNELDNTVATYDFDPQTGALRERQVVRSVPPNAPESYIAHIQVGPDGRCVYVSNRGHDSLAVFAIDGTGELTRLAIVSCGGKWPRHFGVSPDGRWALVANQHSDEVVVLPLDGDGVPGERVGGATAPGAACVQFWEGVA
ncbi:MAG: lactonase family protein [Anaerolineae bacterium]|nr:lactonase family protein [Anaerolineae bacterium]